MKKLKILLVALVACALLATAVGATIAYFTDQIHSKNVFTAGEVKIRLTELDKNGVEQNITNETAEIDYGHIYPGRVVEKNSTITVEGTESAYLAAKIVIEDGTKDLNSVISLPGSGTSGTTVDRLFAGGAFGSGLELNTNWLNMGLHVWESAGYAVFYDATVTDGYVIYILMKDIKAVGSSTRFLDAITFPETWSTAELAQCAELTIGISVFAAQSAGFESCYEAMHASFPTQFALLDDYLNFTKF